MYSIYEMRSSEMSLISGTINFFFFLKFCYSCVKALWELCFAKNLIRSGLIIPKIYTILSSWKQWDTKGISYYNWLYLKIHILDVWLILLDHLTYVVNIFIMGKAYHFDLCSLLQAASFGKCFLASMNSEKFVNMCKVLRVLNAVREYHVGMPLTYEQYPFVQNIILECQTLLSNSTCGKMSSWIHAIGLLWQEYSVALLVYW